MAQEHETSIAPMALQQWRMQSSQDRRHQAGMRLFLFDKQIHRRSEIRVTRLRSVRPEMPAFAAFPDLEALQRMDQRTAQCVIDLNSEFPGNVQTVLPIAFEVIEPIIHVISPF